MCPYLLVRDDLLCRAAGQPLALSAQHVVAVCRSARFARCSRFPAPAIAPRGNRSRSGLVASTAAMLLLAAGATVALARVGNPFSVEPEATPPVASAIAASASPVAQPSRSVTPSPQAIAPLQAPTVSATPRPSATPIRATPTPAAAVRYTVVAGDTLTSVAAAHGVSVARLAATNGLPADSRLRIGQTLLLPAAATP